MAKILALRMEAKVPSSNGPHDNQLLAALPEGDRAHLFPDLEAMDMSSGDVLCEPGCPIRYGYFPTTAVVSLLNVVEDGATTEVAVVGYEGLVGISLFMGGGPSSNRALVHTAGQVLRIKASLLQELFNHGGAMQVLLLRYTQALLTQMAQTAVCNRHHTVDQHLSRWLLLNLDRMHTNTLEMTQEMIAHALGVRREGITCAARKLQKAGLIDYHRGHIIVLDRAGLTARSCECYATIQSEYDRLRPCRSHPDLKPREALSTVSLRTI